MNKLPDFSYVNGKPNHFIPVSDRGLAYGDGLFETILCLDGALILLDEHIHRLTRDCHRLCINLDEQKLKDELDIFLASVKKLNINTGVVKIIITRQFTGRGYGFDKSSASNRLLQYYAGLSYPKENQQGVRLALCDHRLSDSAFAGIKHLNRLDQVAAQKSIVRPFYQEAIVFAAHNEVIECVSSNIFIIKNRQLVTPDINKAGVQGVMRDYIVSTVAPTLKFTVSIKKIYIDELLSADEIFICNSVLGVWPVIAIHVKEYSAGEITKSIQLEINKLGYEQVYA